MIDTTYLCSYLDLLDEIDKADSTLKVLKATKSDMEQKITDMFAAAEASKTSVRGVTFSPSRIIRASTAKGCMPILCERLQAMGGGVENLVKPTINANSLASWVREFDPDGMMSEDEIKAALPDDVRDYINVYEQNSISLTGRKK